MPTYTKETALYDTGAIKNGIDGAAETAKSYITNVTNDGIFVHTADSTAPSVPETAGNDGVHISDDVDIIRNGEVVASYGDAATIGKTTAAHSIIDADGQRFYARNGTTELAKFTTSGVYLGEDDAVAISPTGATKTVWEDESIGNFSFLATIDLSASAVYSILPDAQTFYFYFSVNGSEYYTPFTKGEAHTYENFFYVEYDGESNITVDSYTTYQTEGDFFIRAQIEKQGGVFSFGHRGVSDDVGFFSATFGEGLLASGDEQAVFGRYNESDSTKAVIIGNGTATSSSTNRSNALTVDWNGNVNAQGGYTIGSNPLLKTIRVWMVNKSIPAPANTSYIIDNTNFASDIPSGYTPIGIVGYGAQNSASSGVGASYVAFYRCILLNTNTVQWGFRNVAPTATAIKVDVYADVLLANTGII